MAAGREEMLEAGGWERGTVEETLLIPHSLSLSASAVWHHDRPICSAKKTGLTPRRKQYKLPLIRKAAHDVTTKYGEGRKKMEGSKVTG